MSAPTYCIAGEKIPRCSGSGTSPARTRSMRDVAGVERLTACCDWCGRRVSVFYGRLRRHLMVSRVIAPGAVRGELIGTRP